MDRLENLVGAWALTVSDELSELTASDRSALTTLLAHPDRTVRWLADVLRMTDAGATRLVARLDGRGLVQRTRGEDGRERRVRLTPLGRRTASAVLTERESALARALSPLDDGERADLERLLDKLVGASGDSRLSALRTCRLCDRGACAPEARTCPLEHTVRAGDPHL